MAWLCFSIDWLQQGSRELFGTVIENKIYFLIDTSASMATNIQFVKDKLFTLMQVYFKRNTVSLLPFVLLKDSNRFGCIVNLFALFYTSH